MSVARVIIEQDRDSGLPEDRVQNVLHYTSGSTPAVLSEAVAAALANDVHGAFDTAGITWASTLAPTGRIKVYDMNAVPPRIPLHVREMTGITRGGDSLPNEVAVVISIQAEIASGDIAARRRGRIYVGPFSTTVLGTPNLRDVPPSPANILALSNWVQALAGPHLADGETFVLGVYSRQDDLEGGTVFTATRPVVSGHIDNAFDTQRRRGGEASARTLVTLP